MKLIEPTPGPYELDDADGEGPLGVFGPDGIRIAYLSESALRSNDGCRTPEQDLANGHLLTASKDLYEAAQLIDEAFGLDDLRSFTAEQQRAIGAVTLALVTARGGS